LDADGKNPPPVKADPVIPRKLNPKKPSVLEWAQLPKKEKEK